ncbi:TPA: TcpQ domain-containing protein [Pseudomonas aeruginosa]|uniref:PFGI-1 class ICE element type IV pilus protein PilL2 n=2 Tax=Pseudomonas aeruginosa TaxID=287 RepID=UPI001C9DB2EF|nr:TcpQ domain-containing protein [Pseudomonas aeruginosa]MBY9433235.1 TcpQ domain-containing protein [Pseudomonas aeruginosa]MBY9750126.1 TcpQ domain-containing protein [Pseudomonas aeruginosa]MCA6866179.1 TcpQ domain-containing protein [Pseudomonas aeruginosa]MCA6872490.1 TcpQ domain-containing protein [Pseudomonas aeruginosa]MCA6885763.1 TcpQ domain-containing protein [Pseudomonas aeruginosa]
MTRQLTTLTLCLLLASCTTHKAEPARPAFDSSRNPDLLSPDLYPNGVQPEKEPVVRYGRYTLVSTQPDAGQRDLMAQIIDVTIPSSMNPSVKDAMQYVMSRSGYSLCPAEAGHVNILYTRPLPAAQYKLGPMTLRNTLQVLSGPAWQVKVDEVARQVCFVLRPGYQLPPAPRPKPVQQLYAKPAAPTPAAVAQPSSAEKVSTLESPVVVASVPTPAPITTSPAPTKKPESTTVLPPAAPAKDGHPSSPPAASAPIKPLASAVKSTPPTPATVASAPPVKVLTPTEPSRQLTQSWSAETGSTLRDTLEAWAKRARWTVRWEPQDLNYPIEAPLTFHGSFEDAVSELFPLYDAAERPFLVNASRPQSLIIIKERKN